MPKLSEEILALIITQTLVDCDTSEFMLNIRNPRTHSFKIPYQGGSHELDLKIWPNKGLR